MSQQDELREQAARIAYEAEVENYGGYDWDTAKNDAGKEVGPFEFAPPLYELDMAYEIADSIIALVRADEQRRIAAALTRDGQEVMEAFLSAYDAGSFVDGMSAALAAIGITEGEVPA